MYIIDRNSVEQGKISDAVNVENELSCDFAHSGKSKDSIERELKLDDCDERGESDTD